MAEATDPWHVLLAHPAISTDERVACKILQLSKAIRAAAAHAGQLQFRFTACTVLKATQFAAWLPRNSSYLKTLEVDLNVASEPYASAQYSACHTVVRALQQAATAAEPAGGLQLRSFKAPVRNSLDACTFIQSLPGSHLTHLELHMYDQEALLEQEQLTCVPFYSKYPSVIWVDGVSACRLISSMTNLRALVLTQSTFCPDRYASWICTMGMAGPSLSSLAQLTTLELPARFSDTGLLPAELHTLPVQLRQLKLGMDELEEDGYLKHFPMADSIRKARQQNPVNLSHLTAVTKLDLSMVLPLVAADVLPPNLQQLDFKQCYSLLPVLQLRDLESLTMFPSAVPGTQLQQLSSLQQLQAVRLFYEGYNITNGVFEDWEEAHMDDCSAAWLQLPVVSLNLSVNDGPDDCVFIGQSITAVTYQRIGQLRGLTCLSLDWVDGIDESALAPVVRQLTGLQQLRLESWFEDYDQLDHASTDDAADSDFEYEVKTAGVVDLMHDVSGLPQLSKLHWGFLLGYDEDHMQALDLAGFREGWDALVSRQRPVVSVGQLLDTLGPFLVDVWV